VLVAPGLTEGAGDVSVTFPPGRWRHLFTGAALASAFERIGRIGR